MMLQRVGQGIAAWCGRPSDRNGFLAWHGQLAHLEDSPPGVTPIDRAEPAMRTAASRSAVVRSSSWSWRSPRAGLRSLPTLSLCGLAEPLSSLMAGPDQRRRRRRLDDEGKPVRERVITHWCSGRSASTRLGPALNCFAELHVEAAGPAPGPDRGARLALPAGTCSLMNNAVAIRCSPQGTRPPSEGRLPVDGAAPWGFSTFTNHSTRAVKA